MNAIQLTTGLTVFYPEDEREDIDDHTIFTTAYINDSQESVKSLVVETKYIIAEWIE